MESIFKTLTQFNPISLDEMNEVKLLDRMDLKFIFSKQKLNEILQQAMKDYRVLQIEEMRYAHYETVYFDTDDHQLYTKHHNGKLNRYKVRFRSYLDSNLNFFEVKFKTNKGRTVKSRVKLKEKDFRITGEAVDLLEKVSPLKADDLSAAITVYYSRITLVNLNKTERITIDFDMKYVKEGAKCKLPDLIIAEVKQDRAAKSPFISIMHQHRIHNKGMSKYCIGVASLSNVVKKNQFKSKIKYVNELSCHN